MNEMRVQRRLVKSPPELWAELSDVEALSRHLDRFGDIRITRVEPETTVAWEGDTARGTVEIEASGWGTRVTLTAEVAEPAVAAAVEAQRAAVEPERAAVEPEPVAVEPEPVAVEPEPVAVEPVAAQPAAPAWPPRPAPRRRDGLLSRLFGRPAPLPVVALAPVPVPEPAPVVATRPDPVVVPEPEPVAIAPALAPEPEPAAVAVAPVAPKPQPEPPKLTAEEATGALEAVLDDLGAAHHRPFSRG